MHRTAFTDISIVSITACAVCVTCGSHPLERNSTTEPVWLLHYRLDSKAGMPMHLMHMIWVAGHIIGFFHQPSVIVISVMMVVGCVLIFVFYKVFEHDLFDDAEGD